MSEKGRPKLYDSKTITKQLIEYINNTDNPMIQEFCVNTDITKDTVYRLAQDDTNLSDTIKRCHQKRELYIVKQTEQGNINATFSIFQLKQKCFGWSDKQEIESNNTNLNTDLTSLSPDERQKRINELLSKRNGN